MSCCRRCRDAVSARLDGEEEPGDRLIIENHLSRCPECRGFAEAARELDDLTRGWVEGADPTPEDRMRVDLASSCTTGPAHLRLIGVAACGCSPRCACGCQHGGACRCAGVAA